jgi:hypothetical protein
MEPKRTPGKAEGTEEDADNALNNDPHQRQAQAAHAQRCEEQTTSEEPGRTPGKAEGADNQR